MGTLRKPFQGVGNVLRFNWHFYAVAFGALVFMLLSGKFFFQPLARIFYGSAFLLTLTITFSLLASFYIYDWSALYRFSWLDRLNLPKQVDILNIHAGFDETSELLRQQFPRAALQLCDFYDPAQHTEISIQRARRAYPAHPGTISVKTTALPLPANSVDLVFVILSAHEIRDVKERSTFFRELKRVLRPKGQVVVVEHMRDLANFLAYNFGFFHFFSEKTWQSAFQAADLKVNASIKITPFITAFTLIHHDPSS